MRRHACLSCWMIARRIVALTSIAAVSATLGLAQNSDANAYRMPPKAVADLIDASPTPGVSFSPDKSYMIIMDRPSMPPIAELAQPELRLAGTRINPRTNGRSRGRYSIRLTIKDVADGREQIIAGMPDEARIGNVSWSPDGARIAFSITKDNGIELWSADIESATARRLIGPRLNAITGGYAWLADSRTLVCRLVPEGRGTAPPPLSVPTGPVIKENTGGKAPARTYQDLLKNSYDEALFDHYFTSQAATVTLDGTIAPIGKPGVIRSASPAPDGKHILITTIHRPYSYLVPMYRFPHRVEVWNTAGKLVRQIADLPLAEQVPIGFGAVPTGPRSFGWRADSPATLYWVEAQDGGDPRKKVDVRDKLFTLAEPFTDAPVALISLGLRYAGVRWGDDNLALVSERWWRTRKTRTWMVKPAQPAVAASILFDRSYEDRYSDPGSPLLKRTPAGRSVLLIADGGKTLFLSGSGASPEGSRPFLDRLDLATKETERLWQSEPPYYESVVDLLDEQAKRIVTRRESKNEPPNYTIRDLATGKLAPITDFPHPTPQLTGISKQLVQYERGDGVKLSATLYLPPG
ncbi:MAG: S9 family peptidase, partial [Planctomycetes bacterium]|nr:S9 family peptidase [Planctomycetota bacterium]